MGGDIQSLSSVTGERFSEIKLFSIFKVRSVCTNPDLEILAEMNPYEDSSCTYAKTISKPIISFQGITCKTPKCG
jgi:hypothetical protein